jgi:hypothetical protein
VVNVGYSIGGYWCLYIILLDIVGYSIGGYYGYFSLNYYKLMVVISGYSISGYWWLFYE